MTGLAAHVTSAPMRRLSMLALALAVAGCAAPRLADPPLAVGSAAVPLDRADPGRDRLGRLRYLGGVELSAADPGFGGLSALRWRNGRFHAVIDQGGWASFAPVERGGRLVGVSGVRLGRLLDEDGRLVAGEARRDAESLAYDGDGWLVGFERDHRIARYSRLDSPALSSGRDPTALFGPLGENEGIEALAVRDGRTFLCAERLPSPEPNCLLIDRGGTMTRIALAPPPELDQRVGFPTDADFGADGTVYVLFRSWSGGSDNRGAVVARYPDGRVETLAVLVPPYPVDNMEGIALREEGGRTFLYLVSDDNFSRRERPSEPQTWQRTLLLKFELIRQEPAGDRRE